MKGLYLKRGWWYYVAPTPKGGVRPKPVALRTRDEVTAINLVEESRWEGLLLAAETKDTLEEILPRYYKAKADDRPKTRHGREQILDAFKDRMGNPRVRDISRELIMEWRALLASTGGTAESTRAVSTTTMVSYLIVLRAFLNWCVKEGILRKNPAEGLGKQSSVRKTRRQEFLTLDERERLLARPCRDHVALILHLGFFAGLRIGEMLAMTPDWIYLAEDGSHGSIRVQPVEITLQDGTRRLWEPKTDRGTRTIPMHPRLIAFLNNYGMRRPYLLAGDQPLFPDDKMKSLRFDPKRALASHARLCGVKKMGYHVLRHSFGTHLAMGGAAMVEIAALLGNTVKVAEESYAGYSPRIRQALPGI